MKLEIRKFIMDLISDIIISLLITVILVTFRTNKLVSIMEYLGTN